MRVKVPIVGGHAPSYSLNLSTQTCQNLYLVIGGVGDKEQFALFGTDGTVEFSDTDAYGAEGRGCIVMGESLYAVFGNTVYRINTSGTATALTGTLTTNTGYVWMTTDENEIVISDGQNGYVATPTTVTAITDADFLTPCAHTYQDGYAIFAKKGSNIFFLSDLDDFDSFDGTMYDAEDAFGDNIQNIWSVQRNVWIIKEKTTGIWYNSGDTFPFARNPGGFLQVGCIAPASVAEIDGSLLWLDDRRRVVQTQGMNYKVVSDYHIEAIIDDFTGYENARGYTYTKDGHSFYVLQFPTDDKTLVYDLSTQFWHTRAHKNTDTRHPFNACVEFDGKVCVLHKNNGKVYYYDEDTFTDCGETIRRIRTTQYVHESRSILFIHKILLDIETGVGTLSGTGSDPLVLLAYTTDGHTWSSEVSAAIGAMGNYGYHAFWQRLGYGRQFAFRFTLTDPVKTAIIGCSADIELGTD